MARTVPVCTLRGIEMMEISEKPKQDIAVLKRTERKGCLRDCHPLLLVADVSVKYLGEGRSCVYHWQIGECELELDQMWRHPRVLLRGPQSEVHRLKALLKDFDFDAWNARIRKGGWGSFETYAEFNDRTS